MELLPSRVHALAANQAGMVSRRQLTDLGLSDHDARRLARWRLLAPAGLGVHATHTGQLTWAQRAWAEVLRHAPAALDGRSALQAAGMPLESTGATVHRAVAAHRTPSPGQGVVVRRVCDFDRVVTWNARPPRVRIEPALVLAAATAPDDLRAVGLVTDALGARLTTPGRLRRELDLTARVRRRDVLNEIVNGLEAGAESVLEQAYLRRVERPHALPPGLRQARLGDQFWRRDVVHPRERVVVEFDGRAHHTAERNGHRDAERDAAAAAAGFVTLRRGWGQVVGAPCATARRVSGLLRIRGWAGTLSPCRSCSNDHGVGFQSPGDWNPTP